MIAALVAAALVQSSHVVEIYDPTSDVVDIEAVVRLPELSWRQRNLLEVVANSLVADTPTFSRKQIDDISGRVGQRMRVSVMDDHIQVSYRVLSPDVYTGLSMVGSVLREPSLTDQTLKETSDNLQFRRLNYWRQALAGEAFELPHYTRRDVDDLKTLVFRPENVTIGVSGSFPAGKPSEKWSEIEAQWQPGRLPRMPDDHEPPESLKKLDARVSVFELRGPSFFADDAAFPTRALALFALGSGKTASLFRIAREKLGWSYRQEAVLWPTAKGFCPRLLVVQADTTNIDKRGELLRAELLEDVKSWTEENRKDAIGIAQAYLMRGVDFGPFYFHPDRPVTSSGADDAFMAAYWTMKTKQPWNAARFIGAMGFVTLDDMKATAEQMLASSIVKAYPGRQGS